MPSMTGAGATTTSAEEATRLLYERYARRVFAFSLGRLGAREEAEDAVQTTFLYAFRSLQRGIAPRHELAWLLTIAQNVCRARRRSARRRGGHEAPVDPVAFDRVSAPVAAADELFSLPEALAAMPPAQRQAILLREWHGLSYQEIGEELGVSQSAVEALLFRARRSLATRLERAFRSLFGPLGFARSLLGGGAAKIAAAVAVVAGTSFVATPPSEQGTARAQAAPRSAVVPLTARSSSASAQVSGRSGNPKSADARMKRGSVDATALRRLARRIGRPSPASLPAAAPADPAPAGSVPESPPSSGGGGQAPGPAAPGPAGTVDTSVSTTDGAGPLPGATVDAGATTPAGTVQISAGVDPDSSDPVSVEAKVPPLPPPPLP